MEPFDKKEDYLDQLVKQIRYKKARCFVLNEIEQHIEDQKASYMEEGHNDNIAIIKALEQMGDPIEVGKQLNKIHKPRLEWRILLMTLILCFVGILAQLSLADSDINDFGRHTLFLIGGIMLMIVIYFLGYRIIGRYPKSLWILFITGFYLSSYTNHRVNGSYPYLYAYGMLFIPIYGGILYSYRKQGYIGIVKCLLIGIITSVVELQFVVQSSVYLGVLLSSLIMLSIAVHKDWFDTSNKLSLSIIWGWIPIVVTAPIIFGQRMLQGYQIERWKAIMEAVLHPERNVIGYQTNMARQVILNSELLGGSTEYTSKLPSLKTDYILTYIIGTWGIAAGLLTIGLFFALIGRMLYISYHQKYPLGMFVGLGCSLVITLHGSIYIVTNLGFMLISQVNLPFISYGGGGLIINFITLGIMLSVFRNTYNMKEAIYTEKHYSLTMKSK